MPKKKLTKAETKALDERIDKALHGKKAVEIEIRAPYCFMRGSWLQPGVWIVGPNQVMRRIRPLKEVQ